MTLSTIIANVIFLYILVCELKSDLCFPQAIITDTGFVDAYINLARIHKEVGSTPDALVTLNRALSLENKENHFHAITCRGSVYYAEGRIPSAISDYELAATLKGEDESVVLNLGIFHFAIGNFVLVGILLC
jgi:tetratricopeptide (TPR) repeat protein